MPLSLPRWIARPALSADRTDAPGGGGADDADPDDASGDVTGLLARLVDHAPSPTLVADGRRRVRMLNQAARTLLRRLEPALALHFPGFEVDRLDGDTIDRFYTGSPDGPAMLDTLDGIHRLDLRLGTGPVRLKTTAVRAPGGRRPIGFVLEWIDWSGETAAIDAVTHAARRAADGDLSSRCGELPAESPVAEAGAQLDRLVTACDDLVTRLDAAMDRLGQGDLAARADLGGEGGFARVAVRVNAALERLDHRLGRVASAAAQAGRVGGAAVDEVTALVDAVSGFSDLAGRVGHQVAAIDEVAFQTELLALNAEIEAAKAGAAGQGFAVVAQEVRRLSRRSAQATRGIRGLLDQSTDAAGLGLRRAASTRRALDETRTALSALNAGMAELRRTADAADPCPRIGPQPGFDEVRAWEDGDPIAPAAPADDAPCRVPDPVPAEATG